MKLRSISLLVVALCFSLVAMGQSALRFDKTEWNFGTIKETDGVVRYKFWFANAGARAVVVERVTTDCGCTTPTYSREPVRPAERGYVEVAFDPKGAWGELTKTIVVFSDGGKGTALRIKVNVIPRARTIYENYPIEVGEGVRVTSLNEAFGYSAIGNTISHTIGVVNLGEKEVRLSFVPEKEGKLKIAAPDRLKPRVEALITLTYDLSGQPVYGALSDRIKIVINGKPCELTIHTSTIATDNFAGIDRTTAPRCDISPRFYNFGKVIARNKAQKEFTITNQGKKAVIIRNVATKANTTFSVKEGTTIKAGETISATLTFTIPDGYGIVSGGVALTTNDPEMPLQEIRVVAEIKN